MKHDVVVNLGERSYPIHIGSGILETIGASCKDAGLSGRCLVVTDENVSPLYSETVLRSLKEAGFDPDCVVLPAGEPTKCHEQLVGLYSRAAAHRLDRKCFMLALGGGVMGDLTGYAAATWLRGIKFVQVPTTVLSMVDSSVGGKTGINIAEGKNLVGAFHQPELVMIDLDTLKTLPEREFAAGMSEVVKYGVIWDADLFKSLEQSPAAGLAGYLAEGTMGEIISRCCEIKAEVVRQDEREGGLRGILNFGHTLGHAIENVAGYGQFLHGEGVSIGMVYAALLAEACKGFPTEDVERLKNLLVRLNLPVAAPEMTWSDLRAAMAVDKKTVDGLLKFVLSGQLGDAEFGCEISDELLETTWERFT